MLGLRWAVCHLPSNPPGYDFLQFVQLALQAGANAIRFWPGFGLDHGTEEDERRRLKKIAFRICDDYGLLYELSDKPLDDYVYPGKGLGSKRAHSLKAIKKHLKKPFPLRTTWQTLDKVNDVLNGRKPIVIVIRESSVQSLRNSGPDWRLWAQSHDAVVLEDGEKTDMPPEEYAAYMDLASLTIGVLSGPMSVALYSEHRPYLCLRTLTRHYSALSEEKWKRWGWNIGEQFAWAGKHQKLVWNYEDDLNTIENEYQTYLKEQSGQSLS